MINVTGSWKTTVCGVLAGIAGIANVLVAYLDGNSETVPDWAIVVGFISAACAAIMARDNDKSSESVNAN